MKNKDKEKAFVYEAARSILDNIVTKEPIYRGCLNEQCFCTGACREIVGYREKGKIIYNKNAKSYLDI